MVLGDSILENDHLKFLDLSMNRFGDLGVRNILYPLLICGLTKHAVIEENAVAFLDREKLSVVSKENPDLTQRSLTVNESYLCKRKTCKIQAINLRDNYMTQDSLKHVWLLLEVN